MNVHHAIPPATAEPRAPSEAAERGIRAASRVHPAVRCPGWTQGLADLATTPLPRLRREEVTITRTSDDCFYEDFTSDAPGGVFVATQAPFEVGTRVVVDVAIGELGRRFRVLGLVEFERPTGGGLPGGLGIRFVQLGREARQAIRIFGRMREPLFYAGV